MGIRAALRAPVTIYGGKSNQEVTGLGTHARIFPHFVSRSLERADLTGFLSGRFMLTLAN